MEFELLESFENPVSQEIFSTYSQSFPADEIRNLEQFSALFDKENVRIFSIKKNSERIGYIVIWELSDFAFVEHLEIFEQYRKQGVFLQLIEKLESFNTPFMIDDVVNHEVLDPFFKKRGYYRYHYEKNEETIDCWIFQPK